MSRCRRSGCSGEGMNWLPDHKAGLYLTHNEHRDLYRSVEQYVKDNDLLEDFAEGEYEKAIATDSVWVLQWYPDTPVGFYRIAASTLDAIRAALERSE